MKITAWSLGIIITMMNINPAFAGNRHGHHNSHRGHHNVHHYNRGHHDNHHSYGHHDSHYVRHNYYGHGYKHYNPGHYDVHYYDNGHHGSHAAYAIGGLIVGGAISAILTNSHNNGTRHTGYRQPAYNPY